MSDGGTDRTTVERFPLTWRPRLEPLEPTGAVASGLAARALAKRLLELDDPSLASLQGVAGPGLIVILGTGDRLPWVDGVAYLGRDAGAPSLLLPTNLEPTFPVPLLERAVLAAPGVSPPVAILAEPLMQVPLAEARPIDRGCLAAWLAGEG